jgi:SAM-dependent methyltransferase
MSHWPAHDWSDPTFALSWETQAEQSNPVRRVQLDLLLELLRAHGLGTVLDLGVGSGLVAEEVLGALPQARLIGLDASGAMLALARERLARFGERAKLIEADAGAVNLASRIDGAVDAVFSVQTLHNLEPAAHRRALASTAEAMAPGALLVIADRYAAPLSLFESFRLVWDRAGADEGVSPEDHVEKLRVQGDQPVLLQTELAWLDEIGFDAACLHCFANRAVVVGRRRPSNSTGPRHGRSPAA